MKNFIICGSLGLFLAFGNLSSYAENVSVQPDGDGGFYVGDMHVFSDGAGGYLVDGKRIKYDGKGGFTVEEIAR